MTEQKITFDKFIRWFLIALAILAVFLVVNYLSSVLLPFFIAWFLAYLLYPIVKFVQYKLHVPTRALSIVITLVFVFAVLGGIFYLIVPPMIEQFEKLGDVVTRYLHQTTHIHNFPATIQEWLHENSDEITRIFHSKDFSDSVKTAVPKLFDFLGQTASIVISIVASMITLLYMFFILLDYEYLTDK